MYRVQLESERLPLATHTLEYFLEPLGPEHLSLPFFLTPQNSLRTISERKYQYWQTELFASSFVRWRIDLELLYFL